MPEGVGGGDLLAPRATAAQIEVRFTTGNKDWVTDVWKRRDGRDPTNSSESELAAGEISDGKTAENNSLGNFKLMTMIDQARGLPASVGFGFGLNTVYKHIKAHS
ncbi:hypothetical protein GPALN_014923 [Globodera pallida]|nr:hypothetical protein GPALN_014923 [Globodera pallida]